MFYWSLTIWLYAEIAVTARNIVFEIDASRDELDAEFAKLPPCKIESNISIDGVEYPIVRSHPAPCYVEWHDSWDHINRQLMTLINLGHGMWSYCWQFAFWFLLIKQCVQSQHKWKKGKKVLRLGRNLAWENLYVHLKLSLVCHILQRRIFGCLGAPYVHVLYSPCTTI